jgi:hypothetical protein
MSKKEKKVVKDVKKFTVIRKDWYRGKGGDKSCLANTADKLCCLGFYAEACGLDRQTIRNLPSPDEAVKITKGEQVSTIHNKYVDRKSDVVWETILINQYGGNSKICNQLMDINDNKVLSEDEREKALKQTFSDLGIKVIFK